MIEKYFRLSENKTDIGTEVIAGITTFLATMYIIVLNPAIISETGMPFSGVLTATVLVCSLSSIFMGLYANNPIVLAPGMGLNAFFTYSVVLGMGIKWEVALGAVFWSGIVFLLLSVFNVRTLIVKSIPKQLRYAISAGIGLFIAMIGLINAKFVVSNPATVLGFGGMNSMTLTFVIGLLITSYFVVKKIKGALILGIAATSAIAFGIDRFWGEGALAEINGLYSAPDFSVIFRLDLVNSLKFAVIPVIFAFIFTDMFDSLSTFIGVSEAADLLDENGDPRNMKESLIVDATSTLISGLFGTSSGTSYIESAAGVREGGRTGLTAVAAGLLFLPFMFLSPLLSTVPSVATAPVLVLVGVFMMKPITKINWIDFDDAIPAFLALILIPATYSITQGIVWGFISWTVIKLMIGKRDEVSPMLIIIDIFAIISLIL